MEKYHDLFENPFATAEDLNKVILEDYDGDDDALGIVVSWCFSVRRADRLMKGLFDQQLRSSLCPYTLMWEDVEMCLYNSSCFRDATFFYRQDVIPGRALFEEVSDSLSYYYGLVARRNYLGIEVFLLGDTLPVDTRDLFQRFLPVKLLIQGH